MRVDGRRVPLALLLRWSKAQGVDAPPDVAPLTAAHARLWKYLAALPRVPKHEVIVRELRIGTSQLVRGLRALRAAGVIVRDGLDERASAFTDGAVRQMSALSARAEREQSESGGSFQKPHLSSEMTA